MLGMPKGQREQAWFFVAFVSIAAIFGYWYLVYDKRSAELDLVKERVEKIADQNQKAQAELSKGNVQQLRAQLRQYQQNLSLIRTLVPTGNEVPALLEQVSTAARRAGLEITAVHPQPVVSGNEYDTYRYTIETVGGYHDVATFLTNVGSLTRIVAPVNLQLTVAANPGQAKNRQRKDEALLGAHFQIQTYVAKGGPAADQTASKVGDN